MKRRLFFIVFALVLYVGVSLYHDSIFIENDCAYKSSKTTTLITNSHEASDSINTYISADHKCPFCYGFITDADIQEILSVDLFKERIYEAHIASYISTILIGNRTRAPPTM